jgi:hypothetical protein
MRQTSVPDEPREALRDLVGVVRGRNAGANVEDARFARTENTTSGYALDGPAMASPRRYDPY